MTKVIEARVIVRGDDVWTAMLDRSERFTIPEIAKVSGTSTWTVRAFTDSLVKAEFAMVTSFAQGKPSDYKLIKTPAIRPRLTRDGKLMTETISETLWRSMRMAKEFSIVSLMEYLSGREGGASEPRVRAYVSDLLTVGIIAPFDKKAKTFRLVRNLGARAPRVLSTHIVFDPNSGTAIGSTETSEVQP